METNIIFAGITAIAGLWLYFSMKKESRLAKKAEQERQASLEAWHEEHPEYRWAEARPTTTAGKPLESTSWFSTHGPTE